MTDSKTRGFVLVLVIVALSFVGIVMLVLGEGANTMFFQADRAYLEAVERNLTNSGLAWARRQAAQGQVAPSTTPTELNVSGLQDRSATLTVSFTKVDAAAVTVRIETRCVKGRHTFETSDEHVIDLAH